MTTQTSPQPQDATVDRELFGTQWSEWHDRHEQNRASEHGFLAVTGLHWLSGIPARFDDAPGLWSTSDDGPVVVLAEDETLVIDGVPVSGEHRFGPIEERGGRLASFGDAVVEVARRGGNDIVRPRHPEHPLRTQYRGTPAYLPDPRWVAAGRFVPFDEPRAVTVGAAVEGLQHVYDSPGVIEFELRGERFSLVAFNGYTPGALFVLFTDATSGVTTYAANRTLSIDAPDDDGLVTLDFNRAVNLPCAYTDFATCPLPPAENRLPIGIEAGEKTPSERG
ncbi:DUF1684 domain-containing protein [Compostimonas suwonensis]|uniref:DUF1684 domain-containing protein n=1 Tax=Compostimonas suwonensis TaxID=1048394 RepID=A0A2M9BVY8_9MICO|nr:DUF1684 domain-containing protein [Compostimonas suwonensis]PJJ62127.1 hypothetical protein CLV54_1920 [Compostimonas suwonensis]